jgi:hypothetical protein
MLSHDFFQYGPRISLKERPTPSARRSVVGEELVPLTGTPCERQSRLGGCLHPARCSDAGGDLPTPFKVHRDEVWQGLVV